MRHVCRDSRWGGFRDHARVAGDEIEETRERVARAARRLAADGLVIGTAGNLSARVGEHRIAVTPTGAVLESLEAGDVTVVDRAGEHVDGPYAATSELGVHLGIYDRYGSGAVVHTHAPMATAVGCVLDELPLVHYGLFALGGPVRVAPYRTFGTPELAAAVLDALEGRTAALMANHGEVSHGHDLDAAVEASRLLEWGCTLYWRAAQIGTPRVLGDAERDALIAAVTERGYGTTQAARR
jgi:L-fuculose-phosphate aldolase